MLRFFLNIILNNRKIIDKGYPIRFIKKIIRRTKIYINHKKTIEDGQKAVVNYFKDIRFQWGSFGGADINYFLIKDKKCFAVFRQGLVDQEDTNDLPIQRFNRHKRIAKETLAYTKGGELGLTPRLLFSFENGVVCEYLEGKRMWSLLQEDKSRIWVILEDVIRVYLQLHKLGIAHLDATLKNCIWDIKEQKIKIFDFEYYGLCSMSFELQEAYDYVRIIEHSLRTIPVEYQKDFNRLILLLKENISDEVKHADFTSVRSLIDGIKNYPIYEELRKEVFYYL